MKGEGVRCVLVMRVLLRVGVELMLLLVMLLPLWTVGAGGVRVQLVEVAVEAALCTQHTHQLRPHCRMCKLHISKRVVLGVLLLPSGKRVWQ
jgi:hypothetical protein